MRGRGGRKRPHYETKGQRGASWKVALPLAILYSSLGHRTALAEIFRIDDWFRNTVTVGHESHCHTSVYVEGDLSRRGMRGT